MRLPRINEGGRRGPKRLLIARIIASMGHKNWQTRASMWLDGLRSVRRTYRKPHSIVARNLKNNDFTA